MITPRCNPSRSPVITPLAKPGPSRPPSTATRNRPTKITRQPGQGRRDHAQMQPVAVSGDHASARSGIVVARLGADQHGRVWSGWTRTDHVTHSDAPPPPASLSCTAALSPGTGNSAVVQLSPRPTPQRDSIKETRSRAGKKAVTHHPKPPGFATIAIRRLIVANFGALSASTRHNQPPPPHRGEIPGAERSDLPRSTATTTPWRNSGTPNAPTRPNQSPSLVTHHQ